MHITALVRGTDHVCCRYRLTAFRPFLEAAGHRLDLCAWPNSWFAGWWPFGFSSLRRNSQVFSTDIIVIQRRLLSRWQLAGLRKLARWLIYDVDDAMFLRDSYDARGQEDQRRLQGFVRMLRNVDAVVVGNAFLAEQAAQFTSPRRIHIIPTCVDPGNYHPARHAGGPGAEMVWIGSASTLRGLARLAPLLEQVGRQIPGLSLKILCDGSFSLQNMPVRFRPWSARTEAAELAQADIGISWLPDDAWSRGKCGLKILQYMAAGLPVVANPVGVQAHLVQPEVTGFLARSPQDWLAALTMLSRSPDLRRRMGEQGRRRIAADFSVGRGAAAWLALLDQLGHPQTIEECWQA